MNYREFQERLKSNPENLTVGGSLDLRGTQITALPENAQHYNFLKPFVWRGGKYIMADGVFSEVLSQRGKVWKIKQIASEKVQYLVTDGNGKFAHGDTIQEAKKDLLYKIGDRDVSAYKGLTHTDILTLEKAIEAYRIITGACAAGTKQFVESLGKLKKEYTVAEIIDLTAGRYGNEKFSSFFK